MNSETTMDHATPSKSPSPTMGGKRRRKSSRKGCKRGGAGAADYATAVFGNANSQHAQSGSNIIAANQVRTGGNSKGGNVLNDIAVPAVLLYANHTYGKSQSRSAFPSRPSFRRRSSRSRRNNRRKTFRRRR